MDGSKHLLLHFFQFIFAFLKTFEWSDRVNTVMYLFYLTTTFLFSINCYYYFISMHEQIDEYLIGLVHIRIDGKMSHTDFSYHELE